MNVLRSGHFKIKFFVPAQDSLHTSRSILNL